MADSGRASLSVLLRAAAHHDGVLRLGEVLQTVDVHHAGGHARLRQRHRAGIAGGRKGSDGGEHLCVVRYVRMQSRG